MTRSHQAVSLYSEATIQSADSIEAHPCLSGLFALGTYQVDQEKDEGGEGLESGSSGQCRKDAIDDDDDDDVDGDDEKEEKEKDGKEAIPSSSTSPEYSRRGTLRLKRFRPAEDKESAEQRVQCDTICQIDTAAILDMKWLSPKSSLLSIALADSHVSLYSYSNSPSSPSSSSRATQSSSPLERIRHIQINANKALCLSLDWSDRIGGYEGGYDTADTSSSSSSSSSSSLSQLLDAKAMISQSDGTLALLSNMQITDGNEGETHSIETWKAHDYEAWTTAFDCWSGGGGQIAWSGGDDLCLKGWDLRTPCIDDSREPTFVVKRGFEGGVTSMQSSHLRQHLWAVGSYDGGLRLFDARQPQRPLSNTPTGGGIWRIKWHPSKPNRLLLGCMHDGFKVMQLEGDSLVLDENSDELPTTSPSLHTRFDGHESLAYGCDWDRGGKASSPSDLVYSCSFYDAVWHAWRCDE